MKREIMDLTGQTFGDLTVISRAEDKYSPCGKKRIMWNCLCKCGNNVTIQGSHLKNGHTKSCGCLVVKNAKKNKKVNKYVHITDSILGNYTIGYTCDLKQSFYFDTEDYNKIKDYYWSYDKNGYVISGCSEKIRFHRLVMNCPDDMFVDHINHNKYDNRKSNLRIVTSSQNNMNKQIQSNNTSGVTGVAWHDKDQRWLAYIKKNNQIIRLGEFVSFEEAVAVRKVAEEVYFGEYSYDNSISQSIIQ